MILRPAYVQLHIIYSLSPSSLCTSLTSLQSAGRSTNKLVAPALAIATRIITNHTKLPLNHILSLEKAKREEAAMGPIERHKEEHICATPLRVPRRRREGEASVTASMLQA